MLPSHRTESMYFSINSLVSSVSLTISSCLESSSILSNKLSSSLSMLFLLSMILSFVILPSLYFSKSEVFLASSLAICFSKSLMLALSFCSGSTSPYFSLIRAKPVPQAFQLLSSYVPHCCIYKFCNENTCVLLHFHQVSVFLTEQIPRCGYK